MGERDWLTELSSAIGDRDAQVAAPAVAASAPQEPVLQPVEPPPPVDEELDLMGPGRSLEGWAEELASAFAEDDEPDHDAAPGDDHRRDDGITLIAEPTDDELRRALLRFDLLAVPPAPPAPPAVDEAGLRAAVDVAVAVAAADLAAGVATQTEAATGRLDAAEARLQRIESLLTADLAQLGPAVLADAADELEARVAQLDGAVARLAERVESLPLPDAEAVAALVAAAEAAAAREAAAADEPAEVDHADRAGAVLEPLGELRALVDRLADRVAAQARFLAAHADSVSAEAHQRDDLLRAILARLDASPR